MKKRIIFIGLAIILISSISAYSQFLLTDKFDSFNTDLWGNYSHDGGFATAENGYLNLGTTEGIRYGRGTISSNFSLAGDFISTVDFFMVEGSWQTGFSTIADGATGKLRLSRLGSTLSVYYFSNGDWQLANSFDLPSGYTSSVRTFLEAGNDGNAVNAPAVRVHLDNFYADTANIPDVDGGYLIAQPEPGTIILLGTGLLGLGAFSYIRRRK